MNLLAVCNNAYLGVLLGIVKNGLKLIQIVGPILLLISLGFTFVKLMQHPDDKKIFARIKNSLIALGVLFFIPLLVNAVISMIDKNYSYCWKEASSYTSGVVNYQEITDEERKLILQESNSYESGVKEDDNTSSNSTGSNSNSSSTLLLQIII